MRFVGIDIGSDRHVVAAVNIDGKVVLKPSTFTEDAAGHERLIKSLGLASECLVAMEATGSYWQNIFVALEDAGFKVALVNPIRTNRFAQSDLARTKTDALDAIGIARFAQQKRPEPTRLPDEATRTLRDLVRLRDRVVQDVGDSVRRLHRLVHLGFPEFKQHVRTLESELATSVLTAFPSASAYDGATKKLAELVYDGRRVVGLERAKKLVASARISVGKHHGEGHRTQVLYACEDLCRGRTRLRELDARIEELLHRHEIGRLLLSIDGVREQTAARLVSEVGDFKRFGTANKLASYVGCIPALKHSGKSRPSAQMSHLGNARLRHALWMPILALVRKNEWLGAYYRRLVAGGKKHKVAMVASMRKFLHAVYSIAMSRKPFVLREQESES